jgi:hypothetical protein
MAKAVLLLLAIFLFTVTTTPFLAADGAAPDPVLDIAGEKLRTGVGYYILPVIRGRGGGLTESPLPALGTRPALLMSFRSFTRYPTVSRRRFPQ